MARVVSLQQYKRDRQYRSHIIGVKHVRVLGARLCVKLLTDGELPTEWLAEVGWKVTHRQSGLSASTDSHERTPKIRELYRDAEGVAIEIRPVLGDLPERVEMVESCAIDITTEAGDLHFLNQPSVATKKAQ